MLMKTEVVPARVSPPSAEPRPRRAGGVEPFPGRVCAGGTLVAPEIGVGSLRASRAQQEPSPLNPCQYPSPGPPRFPPQHWGREGQQALASFSPRTPKSPQFLSARVPRVGREAPSRPSRRGAKRWDARKGGEMKKRRLLFMFISFLYFFVFFFF